LKPAKVTEGQKRGGQKHQRGSEKGQDETKIVPLERENQQDKVPKSCTGFLKQCTGKRGGDILTEKGGLRKHQHLEAR